MWKSKHVCNTNTSQYIKDVDHDYGTCAVYDCSECGKRFHVELPD